MKKEKSQYTFRLLRIIVDSLQEIVYNCKKKEGSI